MSELVNESKIGILPERKNFKDWVGLWYLIAKEKGVNDVCTFGKVNLGTQKIEWFDYSHSQADGAGAFTYLLRKDGYRIQKIPQGKSLHVPSTRERLQLTGHFLKKLFVKQEIEWATQGDDSKVPGRHDFPWIIFSQEETERLKLRAKERKLSLNSMLLSCLNRVAAEKLIRGNHPYLWLFPVNMRGPVQLPLDTANHSSAIALELNRRSSAQDVYNQIRYQLKHNSHWGIWWLLNIGKIIGLKGMRYISRKRNDHSFHVGTFSNMGEWPIRGTAPRALNPDEAWIVVPPGTKNFPLSCGCITWNGRLSVTLKVHPSVSAEPNSAQEILQKFKGELERCFH